MIKGMTGFGSTSISTGDVRGIIEVKSVNHRYLDICFYLPIGFGAVEQKIRNKISKMVSRGRITVALKMFKKHTQDVYINDEIIAKYLKRAKSLKRRMHLKGELTLNDLITLPGVVEARETELNPEALWPAIETGLNHAMHSMVAMRKREGRTLSIEAKGLLSRMSLQIKKIRARSKAILNEKRKHSSKEDFSSLQKSLDIHEELSRLSHHVAEFRLWLKSPDATGKKLDFIAQEMQRETNTIGSKLQDKIVSNAVIAIKSKIEKLREQAQNIE